MSAVDEYDRARFSGVRDDNDAAAVAAALLFGPVVEDLDRSGLLSAGHADEVDGALFSATTRA